MIESEVNMFVDNELVTKDSIKTIEAKIESRL